LPKHMFQILVPLAALKQREQNRKGGEGNVHSAEDSIIGRDTDAAKPQRRRR
jgi:hypothetical protein